jgi:ADP-ribosylglycohydrolase
VVTARVTHTHPDAVAGAVVVAVAAAVAPGDVFAEVLRHTAPGDVRDAVELAAGLRDPAEVAATLGTGARTSALDTVPLALWIAARHADDCAEAVWTAAALADDVDTVCAIVGGIVASWTGLDGIPAQWRAAVEPLPSWV